jgi:Holliday junction resolvasome RuvABC DNA-binding subunit
MNEKREEARRARAEAREAAEAREEAKAQAAAGKARAEAVAAKQVQDNDVVPWLRQLGFRADQARRAAEFCATIPDVTLEGRVRAALKFLCPKARFNGRVGTIVAVS